MIGLDLAVGPKSAFVGPCGAMPRVGGAPVKARLPGPVQPAAVQRHHFGCRADQRCWRQAQRGRDDGEVGAAPQAIGRQFVGKAAALALVEESYNKQRTAAFGAQEAFRKYAEDAGNKAVQIDNLLTNAFKNAEDALVNFVKTGKLDFKSLADSIITDLIRIQIKAALGTGGSSGGGLFGLLAGLLGGGAGGGSDAAVSSGASLSANGFTGFAVGTNYVPYDGMKAVLHKGEAVVPAAYNPAAGGGGGGLNVQIHNNNGSNVSASQDDDGTLHILLEKAAEEGARRSQARSLNDLSSGTGPMSRALTQRGVNMGNAAIRRT